MKTSGCRADVRYSTFYVYAVLEVYHYWAVAIQLPPARNFHHHIHPCPSIVPRPVSPDVVALADIYRVEEAFRSGLTGHASVSLWNTRRPSMQYVDVCDMPTEYLDRRCRTHGECSIERLVFHYRITVSPGPAERTALLNDAPLRKGCLSRCHDVVHNVP